MHVRHYVVVGVGIVRSPSDEESRHVFTTQVTDISSPLNAPDINLKFWIEGHNVLCEYLTTGFPSDITGVVEEVKLESFLPELTAKGFLEIFRCGFFVEGRTFKGCVFEGETGYDGGNRVNRVTAHCIIDVSL